MRSDDRSLPATSQVTRLDPGRRARPWSGTTVQQWILLAVVGAGVSLISLDGTVLITALPAISAHLGATGADTLWVMNAYTIAVSGLLLGSGTLGDKVGHRRMFLIGLAIFGAASVMGAFAPGVPVLIAARLFLGVGAAAMMPATLALIRVTFTTERTLNFAIGVWSALAMVCASAGPLVAGVLLNHFWWGSVFLLNVPIVVVAMIATPFVAPRVAVNRQAHWDLLSSALAMIALVAAVVFIKTAAFHPEAWGWLGLSLLVAIVGSAAFAVRQRGLSSPLLTRDVFRHPYFRAGAAGAALSVFSLVGLELAVAQRLQLLEGFTPLQSGMVVATPAIGTLVTTLLAGAVLHRTGLRAILPGGFGIAALGAVIVVLAGRDASSVFSLVGLFTLGMGLGAVMAVSSIAIMSNAPKARAGMASAVEEVSYELGALLGAAVLGSAGAMVFRSAFTAPPGAPEAARQSLADAVQSAHALAPSVGAEATSTGGHAPADAGDTARAILEAAHQAGVDSYLAVAWAAALALAVGGGYTLWELSRRSVPSLEDDAAAC